MTRMERSASNLLRGLRLLCLIALIGGGLALAQQGVEGPAEVAARTHADFGTYLVDGEGMTLYAFVDTSMDTGPTRMAPGVREASPPCTDGCASAWPPLLTDGAPQPGSEVDPELLGTTERPDGSVQVVYNGWPLYLFASDVAPGDVTGQAIAPPAARAFGATWYLVAPDGSLITAERAPADDAGAGTGDEGGGDGDGDDGDGGGGGYY